jgi:hypothetical protein
VVVLNVGVGERGSVIELCFSVKTGGRESVHTLHDKARSIQNKHTYMNKKSVGTLTASSGHISSLG